MKRETFGPRLSYASFNVNDPVTISEVQHIVCAVRRGLVGQLLMAMHEDEERPILQHFLRKNLRQDEMK